jgi:hypothetical protein
MAELEKESLKKHGDELEKAVESREQGSTETAGKDRDPIPMPENGGHEKSHAAHLGHVHEQTKPADKLKQGVGSNTLREPPMVVSRVGKQHR